MNCSNALIKQMPLWASDIPRVPYIVNVAQIPQRSPFRYPGGKTWLVPHVRHWLGTLTNKPKTFIEPFVGGGIVSLTVAFENLADHIIMVELDQDVAALWQTMLSDDNDWLTDRIAEFDMTLESVRHELSISPTDTKRHAFQTLLRNRTNHGGILAPGSGVLKHGENGKGIKSRWYAKTLCKRIINIKHVRDKITFIQGDGINLIKEFAPQKSAAFFIDPPYTAGRNGKRAGTRLYTHNELDHEELFRQAEKIKGELLMTYDNAEEVIQMASRHGFMQKTISMMNTHHATMQELIIGHDLTWSPS
jgi:DNA adenine methylase